MNSARLNFEMNITICIPLFNEENNISQLKEIISACLNKYSFIQRASTAFDGICMCSSVPLRIATGVGVTGFLASIFLIFCTLISIIFFQTSFHFYVLIIELMFLIGSVQIFFIGIIGEYIGRTYREVVSRPQYLIDYIKQNKNLNN